MLLCPNCAQSIKCIEDSRGQRIPCPHCHSTILVPGVSEPTVGLVPQQSDAAETRTSSVEMRISAAQCPSCGGKEIKRVESKGGFSVDGDRMCKSCGTIWRPPFAKGWAVVAVILAGPLGMAMVVGVILYVIVSVQRGEGFQLGFFFAAGVAGLPVTVGIFGIFAYAVKVLRGEAGQGHVIRQESPHEVT